MNRTFCIALFILFSVFGHSGTSAAAVCDVNNDHVIDKLDIAAIFAARNTPANGPNDPRDADGDGTITVNDGRKCVLLCTLPACATPPVKTPKIEVVPNPLTFGDVFTGSTATGTITVRNTGTATLLVDHIDSSGAPFIVFPPTLLTIEPGAAQVVAIGFGPPSMGTFTGTISFFSNASNTNPAVVTVNGDGVQPGVLQAPNIQTPPSLDFGGVEELVTVEKSLTVANVGNAPLVISKLSIVNDVFQIVLLATDVLPIHIEPGASHNLAVRFTPPLGSAGSQFAGVLNIESNDPDEAIHAVALSGESLDAQPQMPNGTIVRASVNDVITASTCANVSGTISFNADSNAGDSFQVTLTDQGGNGASSGVFQASDGAASVAFDGVDACGLADGVIQVRVVQHRGGVQLPPFIGDPAVKNTSTLPPPVLEPLPPVTTSPAIDVCGTSRVNTTVRIEGGTSVVSTVLDGATTHFCLTVPLQTNAQNVLIASAIDNLAPAPKPVAYAAPVFVVQLDTSKIIIADVQARPLTEIEIATLVENGVISLDDPNNYNVSMFTVVLTIGSFPVTITQPVAVHKSSGSVSYGAPSYGGGAWQPGRSTGGGGTAPAIITGCTVACGQVVVIRDNSGNTIPGVIIIDGRIKTLKEFFQVTLALFNTSSSFVLKDMRASIELPPGLSPVSAGPGSDIGALNTGGATDKVTVGDIGPGATGTGQFIIRGDTIGIHSITVDFQGFITQGGLPKPVPVSGSAGTRVQVLGPPELSVVVRHPSNPSGPDVTLDQIYELLVEITNQSNRPALYTSLELFVGGSAQLVDENDVPLAQSNSIRTIGTILPGRTARLAYRVKSLAEGEIIACQAIASANITLSVDTGPQGASCLVNNMYPASFQPLPADLPPTVIGINPLNGQRNVPLTISTIATFTPRTACLIPDTWTNVVTALIDPSDPSKGIQVVSADLDQTGTFYLEELSPFGEPVRHIPVDLTLQNPPAGGTTIAVLRLGLPAPLSQFFLKPNTTYRATLAGGAGGICSMASGAEMPESFSWTFSTAQICAGIAAPIASLAQPANGAAQRPLNQSIVLQFTNRMNPASFSFVTNPVDIPASTFGVYQNALESGGEISGGTAIAGSGVFNALQNTLTYTPAGNLAADATVHVRVTNGLRDTCGNLLQTPPNGVQLFSFHTAAPDITPPAAPQLNSVPVLTKDAAIQVSGVAEPGSIITVAGGQQDVTTTTAESGLFSVLVPLVLNANNPLQVQAADASGNASIWVGSDVNGAALTVKNDSAAPQVAAITPSNGAAGVALNTAIVVTFNEPIDMGSVSTLAFTLEAGAAITGSFNINPTGFTFTPAAPLAYGTTYNVHLFDNGIRDVAGNPLSHFISTFTTLPFPAPQLTSVTPDTGVQGSSVQVIFSGSQLAAADAIVSGNPGVTGTVVNATENSVTANLAIAALAATGATTLGVHTPGGDATLTFTVLHKAPVVTAIVPSQGLAGTSTNVEIQGSGLTDVTGIAVSGGGVTVIVGAGDDTFRSAQFNIASTATAGVRTVTVTTPGGSAIGQFEVTQQPDNTPPTIVSVHPANGATNVPLNTVMSLIFSEPIDPASVNDASFALLVDNTNVPGSFNVTGSNSFTFTPATPLVANKLYTLRLPASGIKDVAGNGLAVQFESAFNTVHAAPPSCVATPSGVVAWWPFDEATGSVAGDIIGQKPGAHLGGVSPGVGKVSNAIRLNGLGSFVNAGDSDLWAFGNGDFTIEFWVNFATSGGGTVGHPSHIFIGNDEGPFDVRKWFFALGGGFLNFHINGPGIGPRFFPLVPFNPSLNQWYHLALTRAGTKYTIYVNATPAGSATDATAVPNANAPLTIGQAESLGFVNGSLDELTIYHRALSPDELQAIVTADSAGKCKSASTPPPFPQSLWTQTVGIEGGGVHALAVDTSTPGTVYAGTDGGGVFKSTNGGATWSTVNSGLTYSAGIFALAVDPAPGILYAATWGDGVFKSVNSGVTWSAANDGLTNLNVSTVAVDPVTPGTLYVSTWGGGVFKSSNAGATWTTANADLTNLYVSTVAVDPVTPGTLYAGIWGSGVFKSTNGGSTWSAASTGLTNLYISIVAVDPVSAGTLYATSNDGIFKSTNGGATWSAASTGLIAVNVGALAIDPATPNTLYAGTGGGAVFKSTDGGTSWSTANTGVTAVYVGALAMDPTTPGTLYAGTDGGGGVFKSVNGGATWSAVNTGITKNPASVYAVAGDPSTPGTLYAGTFGGGMFKSTNGGTTWSTVNAGLTNLNIYDLAMDPATPGTLYAGTFDGGVFKSTNGGSMWSAVNTGLPNLSVAALVVDPTTIATLYAGTSGGGVFVSADGGATWSAANIGLANLDVYDLTLDPSTPGTLYAGTSGGGVFKSTNGGAMWSAVNTGLPNLDIAALAVDPTTPATLYAGTSGGGVFVSADSGVTWSAANTGLTNFYIYDLAVNPATPGTLYVGTEGGGVFKSTDGGASWNATNTGLIHLVVYSLALGGASTPTLFAGTANGGVYAYPAP